MCSYMVKPSLVRRLRQHNFQKFSCAFEKGYNAIGGILAQDIVKWSDFKMVVRQLENLRLVNVSKQSSLILYQSRGICANNISARSMVFRKLVISNGVVDMLPVKNLNPLSGKLHNWLWCSSHCP